MSTQPKGILETGLEHAHTELVAIENKIIDTVQRNLEQRIKGLWTDSDDALFGTHTAYVAYSGQYGFQLRPASLWINRLWPMVEQAEQKIGQLIHKGAPFYNTGLCYFFAGDVSSATQFFDAAGDEDERRNPGSARTLITGGGLAEQLLQPIYDWLNINSNADYSNAAKLSLTHQEIRELINFLSNKTANAVLFISALQRIVLSQEKPDVYALHLHRVRALSDLILVFESNLRSWQPANLGQLGRRSCELLRPNVSAFNFYNNIDGYYGNANPRHDWESIADINSAITAEIQRFDAQQIPIEKIATALYITYRLRNSLMHVLEDQLDIFMDYTKLVRLANFAIISIRLSKYGHDNQINTL